MSTTVNNPLDDLTIAEREKIINSAVDDISHIATLPEITVRIIELVEDPDATAHDLHMVIANDPALSARVLKVVNSAFYALPGQIGSITRATVLLGLNAVKNIAIAASLAKLFRGGRLCPSLAARDLWENAIAVAAAVKLLCQKLELNVTDEAFLAGLMHDVGVMVELQSRRPKLLQVIDRVETQGECFREAELKVFGVTHEDFGQALCMKWKFPEFLQRVTGYHHRPMELADDSRAIACLVHVADVMAARQRFGYTKIVDSQQILPGVLDQLKLSEAMLDDLEQQLPAAYEVADSLLN